MAQNKHLDEVVFLAQQHTRLNVGDLLPVNYSTVGEIDYGFKGFRPALDDHEGSSVHLLPHLPGQNLGLGWFLQRDERIQARRAHNARGLEDFNYDRVLTCRQGIHRMLLTPRF